MQRNIPYLNTNHNQTPLKSNNKNKHAIDFDYKSPPTPTTPNSKFIPGLNDTDINYLADNELHSFHLNPPIKSLSLHSISSNKENKDNNCDIKPTKKRGRGRGRPKGSKNKIKKVKSANRKRKYKKIQNQLQLPNLKHIPKTVTQFTLPFSSPYNTPQPQVSIPPSIESIQPYFPDIEIPFWDSDIDQELHFNNTSSPPFNNYNNSYSNSHSYSSYYNYSNYTSSPLPLLVDTTGYYNMNTNEYNNDIHPNKKRKITHSETYNVPGSIQQYQSENNINSITNTNSSEIPLTNTLNLNKNNNNLNVNVSISGAESENEPIISPNKRNNNNNNMIMEEEEKNNNNITKRALFKEKLSNININTTERDSIVPNTAPNDTNRPNEVNHNNVNNLELSRDNNVLMDSVSAPILPIHNNNINTMNTIPNVNNNLDWFGTDENINTLNGNNHPFDINMFPMGMGDDMKDMGLGGFMMNDIIPNHTPNDMMDMDLIPNNTTPINHRVKQENNVLPPPINNNNNNNNYNYHNNIPRFSISSEPPQQSNMFMDQIATNNIYQNDYQYGNSNNMIRSRSLQNGPNALRPANLPTLRRSQSSTSDSNLVNNNIIIKPNKTISNNKSHSGSGNNISQSSHVLTPFDYPLSNPTISRTKGISYGTHTYYNKYITNTAINANNNTTNTKIKQEKNNNNSNNNNCNNNTPIHSAPLYNISSLHNNNSNNSLASNTNSLSATPNPNINYNFSLSSSLLNIPQNLTQNQHPNPSFPPSIQYDGYNDGYNDQNNRINQHFNFLWWYPEVKFCELDPQLVPLP